MSSLRIFISSRSAGLAAADISRVSARAMNAPLATAAELWVSTANDDGVFLGAFQRACEIEKTDSPIFRRASGGPAIAIARGSVHVALALAHPAALVACDAPRLVNRYVRPLMRALSSFGEKTPYFGRDWLSAQHRPVAWVGFAHDSSTKRAVIEAVVGVNARWSLDRNRASFLGKSEITLSEANARSIDAEDVAEAIAREYANAFSGERADAAEIETPAFAVDDDPKWAAEIDEVIGIVAAGRDRHSRLRVGGQFMASRDAIARLEEKIATFDFQTLLSDIGAAVDAELARPEFALHGIKSLLSVRDAIAHAILKP
jgi:hypothetical protein